MMPKIESLISTLDELSIDIACVTETWLVDNHESVCRDISDRTDYDIIGKNRAARKGGGVCIIYNRSHISMNKFRLPESEFEIVAAIGQRTAQRRKVLAIAAYLPPKYNCLLYTSPSPRDS